LESGALSTDEFKEFAKEVVLFTHITSYVEGATKYPKLLQEKGGRGFPYLAAMDAKGNVIGTVTGARTVENFRKTMQDAQRYLDLSAKEDRTLEEEMELYDLDWGMGNLTPEQARERIDGMEGLTEEQKSDLLIPVEIREHMPKGRDRAAALAAGEHFAEMYAEGRLPKSEADMQPYYILMMQYAESQTDPELFGAALEKLREMFGDNPRAARFFEQNDAKLEQLKQKKAAEGEGD
jgi:hypothetical protein